MKRTISILMSIIVMIIFTSGCSAATYGTAGGTETITMRIGDPVMLVNGISHEIDEDRGTVPVIENDRTLLPVRAVIEAMGGTAEWKEEERTVVLTKDDTIIQLTVGSNTALLNGEEYILDTVPVVINDRTMLPIRFVAEGFGYKVDWDGDTMTVTLSGGTAAEETPETVVNDTGNDKTEVDNMDNPGNFDFETKTVMLNSGYEMPINGLGTYSLHGDTCINSVKSALESGVRLIDTASAYGNEAEVGQAVREAMAEYGIKRDEIFVITKIYPGSEMADPETSIQACIDRLNIGYVDMMLLHHPDPNDVKAYKAMEKFVAEGKIHSIGLSNWYVEELEEFLPQVDTVPALVQNEIHPYYQENDVIPYIQSHGITVQGWYPLGGRGHTTELLGDPVILEIAEAHGVSAAQVILRWNLQKGVVVIPGSSNPDHIRENTELYHFSLTDEEMQKINDLDRNEKHDWY